MTLRRPSRPTLLRAAAAALAAAAVADPAVPGTRAPSLRVLLADVSASCGAAPPSDAEVAALVAGLRRGDRVAVVAFAEDAAVAAGPCDPADLDVRGTTAAARPWGTSLARALRTAAALAGRTYALELVVATDGRATDDAADLDAAVSAVVARGGATMTTVLRDSAPQRPGVRALAGPGRAVAGESVDLEASGVAGADGATVELLAAGTVLDTRRVDGAGPWRVTFRRTADAPGTNRWEARTREAPDVPGASASVVVGEPGAVALLHGGTVRPEVLAAAGRAGAVLDVRGATAADVAAAVAGHDAVVVDDAAAALAPSAGALRSFVAAGGGLVALGGPSSFAADETGGSRAGLDALLPLRSEPPADEGVVLYLAIDGSGSMGEPWPGTSGGAAREAAVRAAAEALVRAAPDGTRLVLRRFRERPVSPGGGEGAPADLLLSGPRDAAVGAVRALPGPGGSTAFLPVLAEALDVLGARAGRTRAAAFLTDGRSAEEEAPLRVALRRLVDSGARVTVVVPGVVPGGADVSDAPLLRAAAGTDVAVRTADDPARLAAILADVERSARAGEPFVSDRAVEMAPAAAAWLVAADVPGRALRLVRAWPSPDARVLARTSDGLPVAALRTEGAGVVAAVAARAPDARWFSGDGGRALVTSLLRAVRRRGAATVRVERSGAYVVARIDVPRGAAPAAEARFLRGGAEVASAPLDPAGDGLVAALLPAGGDADAVRFVAADGAEVAAAGLDRPAPREVGDVPVADLGGVAARLRPPSPPAGVPSRPWLAGAAVVLLVLGSVRRRVKSAARRAR